MFAEALALNGDARLRYLDGCGRADPVLRAAVDSMLAAHAEAGSFAKQGYDRAQPTGRAGTGWLGSINARVNGDTRFDIELVRR